MEIKNGKKLKSLEQFDDDVCRGDLIRFQLKDGECAGYFLGVDRYGLNELSTTFPDPSVSQVFGRDKIRGKKILGYEILRRNKR